MAELIVIEMLMYDCCNRQVGRDQPVVEQATAVSSDAVDNRYTGKYNAAPQVPVFSHIVLAVD